MRPLAQKALKAIQEQGGWIVNHDLLDVTLQEIGRQYKPGLIGWIRERPDRWQQLIALESRINEVALAQIEVVLREALKAYHLFFEEMMMAYETSNILPLFLRGTHE